MKTLLHIEETKTGLRHGIVGEKDHLVTAITAVMMSNKEVAELFMQCVLIYADITKNAKLFRSMERVIKEGERVITEEELLDN